MKSVRIVQAPTTGLPVNSKMKRKHKSGMQSQVKSSSIAKASHRVILSPSKRCQMKVFRKPSQCLSSDRLHRLRVSNQHTKMLQPRFTALNKQYERKCRSVAFTEELTLPPVFNLLAETISTFITSRVKKI